MIKKKVPLVDGWKVGEQRHGEVTLRELQLGDFLEAKNAGLRRAKLAGDGKTRVPSHAAMGIEMLRLRIVELDGEPVEVTRGMFEGLSPRDLLCLQNGFDEMDEGVMDELQALLRRCTVELDGEPVEVTRDTPADVSMAGFMTLLDAFGTEDQSTLEALYKALMMVQDPEGSPTLH
jgi:phage FluMu protein gp41